VKEDRDISDLLKKADESLQVAEDLIRGKHFGFSASRAYYAMFYATEAILSVKNLYFSKHKAVLSAFGKEFVKTGLFPAKLHQYLTDAFSFRQLGDYGAPGAVSSSKARELLTHAKEFLKSIEAYLTKEGYVL
jgi:uncharacterized protein (UPF0332 family)